MQTNVQKWGNSLAIRIPSYIAQQLSLEKGDLVDIITDNQQISIRPKKFFLADMLNQITEANLHDEEWDDFSVRGKEIW
jgi:antitoxin MazE